MKRQSDMNLLVLGGALALAAGPAAALDVYLAAKPFAKSLPMSDGTLVAVPMWVYATDTDGNANGVGDCWEAANAVDRLACIAGLAPEPSGVPGPRLTVPAGDATLTIHLSNGLPEPTSIVVPGLSLPTSGGSGPTWSDGSTGGRGGDLTKRVRSYGAEAAASGGTQSYSWSLARSGTFAYHSGTWPQKQVYMGLYGALTRDFATGEVFPGVMYDSEVTLYYSDVDPVLNRSIAKLYDPTNPSYADVAPYTTSIGRHAQWFLVNGEPFVAGLTTDIPAGATGDRTLVRLLSAASETHVPTFQGLYLSIHAEDGIRYNWQNANALGAYAPGSSTASSCRR